MITGCALADTSGLSAADRQQVLARSIMAIGLANDVPTAIAAFNAGAVADKDNLDLNRAFVRKMVDLGAPEAAFAQAQKIEALAPGDGLALAVLSYSQAAAGDVPAALVNIVAAINTLPNDPFVLRTAGQLAAWTAQMPKDAKIPGYVLEAMNEMATAQAARKVFADAYAEAKAAYAELAAAEAQAASAPQPATAGADPAWATIPMTAEVAGSEIDPAEAFVAPAVDPAATVAVQQQDAGWGEFAPGVAVAPLQGDVGYDEGYYPAAPVTVVNVYNDYDYYYPVDYSDDCNWYPTQVVFLGNFRRHGLLVGRCRHRDVIVDHARNVFVGDARHIRDRNDGRHDNHVVIDRARRVTAGPNHQLIASKTPRTLLADNRGSIVNSRIERTPIVRGTTNFPAARNGGAAQNFRTAPPAGIAARPGIAGNPVTTANPLTAGRPAAGADNRFTFATGAAGAPGRNRFDQVSRTNDPPAMSPVRGAFPGNAGAPNASAVTAAKPTEIVPPATVGAGTTFKPRGDFTGRTPEPLAGKVRGDTPAMPVTTAPPFPGTIGKATTPASAVVRSAPINTAGPATPTFTRKDDAKPIFTGDSRPGVRSVPTADVFPKSVAATPIAPPAAPVARTTFTPPPAPARVETPARAERATFTPPPAPAHVDAPAHFDRPAYTPPAAPAHVDAPSHADRSSYSPPSPPSRSEAPAAASAARSSGSDSRDNNKDAGNNHSSGNSGGGHSSGGGHK
jgi:hypothetical protein